MPDNNTDPTGKTGEGNGENPVSNNNVGEHDDPNKNTSKPAVKANAEGSDNKPSDKFITITQGEFDRIVGQARKDGREAGQKGIADLKAENEAIKADRDKYRTAEVARVTEEFNKLPEEVRATAMFDIAKINEGDTFAQIVAWLPKANALAAKFSPAPAEKKETPPPQGNKPDPKPQGGATDEAKNKEMEAAKRRMRRGF